jgi:hypothetical protein
MSKKKSKKQRLRIDQGRIEARVKPVERSSGVSIWAYLMRIDSIPWRTKLAQSNNGRGSYEGYE